MNLLTISVLVLCALTLSFAAPEYSARMDLNKSMEKNNVQKPVSKDGEHHKYLNVILSNAKLFVCNKNSV